MSLLCYFQGAFVGGILFFPKYKGQKLLLSWGSNKRRSRTRKNLGVQFSFSDVKLTSVYEGEFWAIVDNWNISKSRDTSHIRWMLTRFTTGTIIPWMLSGIEGNLETPWLYFFAKTRKHSSRIHTARLLTIGGVCVQGLCVWGVSWGCIPPDPKAQPSPKSRARQLPCEKNDRQV